MNRSFELTGRVCVLTGATGGIGRALAHALVAAGSRLILGGRNTAQLESLAAVLPSVSVAATCAGSLTDSATQEALTVQATDHRASVLINLAGVNHLEAFDRMDQDAIVQLVNTNLLTPMQLTRLLLPVLNRQPAAMIVNIGSVFGSIGHPGYVAYSASKFGLRGFSEALGRELADTSVRVVHVAPRATRTAMNEGPARQLNQQLGNREDSPEQVAKGIVRAMQRGKSLTTLGWPERAFVFINQFMPSIIDRALTANLSTIKAALPTPSTQE